MRVLLIFDVFLPELVAQLRIRLFLRRFADLSRDDVVVPAVGDILGCSIRSATALARTASGTATAAGPDDTTRLTSAPRAASAPACGSWFMTVLTGTVLLGANATLPSSSPAEVSVLGTPVRGTPLTSGTKVAGATVHFVDEETDHGPIIVQGVVPVLPGDTEDSLRARILAVEHEIYPAAIQLFAEGRLEVQGRRVIVRGAPPLTGAEQLIRW